MEKLRVFISSTMDDLREGREALANCINKNDSREAVYVETFTARKESPREVCLREVRDSHIYIGIFKNRYGYVPQDDNPRKISAVELEYEEAKNRQLAVIILIYKNVSNREPQLEKFLEGITDFDKGYFIKEVSNVDELVQSAMEAIEYEISSGYIEYLNNKRREAINNIYDLSYFKRMKEIGE